MIRHVCAHQSGGNAIYSEVPFEADPSQQVMICDTDLNTHLKEFAFEKGLTKTYFCCRSPCRVAVSYATYPVSNLTSFC